MTVHDLPEPTPSSWASPPGGEGMDLEALLLAWSEALRQESRAEGLRSIADRLQKGIRQREQSLATLRQAAHVLSATSRTEAIAPLARDLIGTLLDAKACLVWVLGDQGFQVRAISGVDRPQASLDLPAPNPFPQRPMFLPQWQTLERTDLPSPLPVTLQALGPCPLYVPLEHQGLLVGFLLLDALNAPDQDPSLADTLELLQRLIAAALFHAWNFRDLEVQREQLREDGAARALRMEALQREIRAVGEGQGHRMEFLACALDQLRPILGQILGTMTRLKQDQGLRQEEQGNLLLEGLLQGKRMAEFLRDLTEMTHPGRHSLAPSPVALPLDLGALLTEIRPFVENLPRPEESELDWPEMTDLPEILAQRDNLRLVLLALCQGASRLNPRGDLHLWVEREPMHLAIRLLLEGLEMELPDPGIHRTGSLPPAEYYARGKSSHGLGLVIAQHLVKGMGGNLRLDRDFFGQGAVISLEFPLA